MLKNISNPNDKSSNDSVKVRLVKAFEKISPLVPTVVNNPIINSP